MSVFAACLSLAVFMVLLKVLRVDSSAIEVLAISRRATSALQDPRLSDEVKEKIARRYSLRLLVRFFFIAIPSLIAGCAALAVLILIDALNIVTLDDSTAVLTDWTFVALVLVASLLTLGVVSAWRRRRRPE